MMRRHVLTRSTHVLLIALLIPTTLHRSAFPLVTPAGQAQPRDELLEEFTPYVDYLNEFTERRRLKVTFTNEQSIFYGAQVGYVNAGRGNFTFVRRDLVTVGRVPLVTARVYDSGLAAGEDFGRGWRLSAAETVRLEPDGSAVLMSESATSMRFIPSADGFIQAPPQPSDIFDFRPVDSRRFRVKLRTGFLKEYTLLGALYRLTRVEDRNGNAVTLKYADGKLVQMRGGNHRLINIERDTAGHILSVTDDQARRVGYRYNADGRLVEVTDLGGNRWRYEYDEQGRMIRAIDPLHHVNFADVYDASGRVTELQAPGRSYRYRYDPAARRTRVTDGNGFESEYRQNDAGITVTVRNPLRVETRLVLDERNRVRQLYRNEALRADMSYDSRGRLLSLVKYGGDRPKQLSYVYDEVDRLVEISSGDDTLALSYDDRGHLLERVDRDGVTRYSYSPRGDLTRMSLADGRGYQFDVDADGQITMIEDQSRRRRQTRFKYDKTGKLSQTRFADGTLHSYRYTRLGFRRVVEFDDGAGVTYTYNVAGSITRIRVTGADGALNGQSVTLDEAQRVRMIENPQGEEMHLRYDRMGNLTTLTTGEETTRFAYDGLNRLIEVIPPEGKRLRYAYGEGEPDLRVQLDQSTRLNPSARLTSGLTFSSGLELLRNRTGPSAFGVVRFDRAMIDYRLSSEYGVLLPDMVSTGALARMRLLPLGEAGDEAKRSFGAPSNVMFIPPEYWAVNCCILLCGYFLCNPYDCGGGGGGQDCFATFTKITLYGYKLIDIADVNQNGTINLDITCVGALEMMRVDFVMNNADTIVTTGVNPSQVTASGTNPSITIEDFNFVRDARVGSTNDWEGHVDISFRATKASGLENGKINVILTIKCVDGQNSANQLTIKTTCT